MDAQRRALDELMGAGKLPFSLDLDLDLDLDLSIVRSINPLLMFAARNMTEEEKKGFKEIRWDDKEVCGAFMVRFCPHDLFVNTKSDLGEFFNLRFDSFYEFVWSFFLKLIAFFSTGPCPRIHDLKLKER